MGQGRPRYPASPRRPLVPRYRAMASRHRDADDRHPQHGFFYPEEEYVEEHLDKIAALCADGFGEIEIHLHHDDDTAETSPRRCAASARPCTSATARCRAIRAARAGVRLHPRQLVARQLARRRPLVRHQQRAGALRELGCYADFTLPSAPGNTQTSTVNAIYYATDDPLRPNRTTAARRCASAARRATS